MTTFEPPVGLGPVRCIALAIRHSLLDIRAFCFRSLGMQTGPSTQISVEAGIDRTNPGSVHIGDGTLPTFDKSQWSPRVPWPWSNAVSITGEPLGPFVMGRRIGGRWEYRNMTGAEARDWQDAMQSY